MEKVKIWEENVMIPTYDIGKPDKNPMFLEKRVYQGSSGRIYPYPTIDKIYDTKKDRPYKAVFLENEYLKIMILPELGGRIQRAYDKTNGYDFVYYNRVIKPALVGLCGPWISGGIEFNWPQHHRPTTFSPVDYLLISNTDGSKTCRVNDVDQMYGTKGEASFTLYPGKAYLEIRGQLYNRTAEPQTFLWWANPAVSVNENTQSVFPPDVHAVMDHGKRDVSRFPIATGVYYKHDYSAGVDISRYKNIPVPTSYMAEKSNYDFVGGYDYGKKAGILHVADHHISPGKKQWTWGCGDFGKAWDRNLTDSDGPYIELMTGVFTDNQPDFAWLAPMEEKTFTQYFMPYKNIGYVRNATRNAMVNLEISDGSIISAVYATQEYPEVEITLTYDTQSLFDEHTELSPEKTFEKKVSFIPEDRTRLTLTVKNGPDILVSWTPEKEEIPVLPKPAEAAKDPEEIMTNEELYLTGLHIEQYRHATYLPDPYYLEGLKRDPCDMRINTAYGMLLFRRGLFSEAESHFRIALKRATWKNPNPYDSEPYYDLGLALFYQGKYKDAYDAFFKASWSSAQQETAFYYLACIDAMYGHYSKALDLAQKGLVKNSHNIKIRGLLAWLLRRLGRIEDALAQIRENLEVDPFDYVSLFESAFLKKESGQQKDAEILMAKTISLARDFHENILMIARDYAEFGAYQEASDVLGLCTEKWPMLFYYRAYYNNKAGLPVNVWNKDLKQAAESSAYLCFPNKLEDISVLEFAIRSNPADAKASYYLGCLWYDKLQYNKAVSLWEKSAEIESSFPTVWRCLALAYYNKRGDSRKALFSMEKAWHLDETDSHIFMELDQLYKKLHVSTADRLTFYESHRSVFMERDVTKIEYATLLNMSGNYQKAYDFLMANHFHPWEGGEGKATTQYTMSLVELARSAMKEKRWGNAAAFLHKALIYPENLGEGKLEGCKDNNIYYYLGITAEALGKKEHAKAYFEKASTGTDDPSGVMYYNDQPADMILYEGLAREKLGQPVKAKSRFYKLLDYGEQHMYDHLKIGYFAVSLPDFQIFEDDLDVKNKAHCCYLIGLANIGLGNNAKATDFFSKALEYDPSHQNAQRYLAMCNSR